MKLYGLVGHPLSHSFSATFFNEKFKKENIDAEYLNFDISSISHLNINVPHSIIGICKFIKERINYKLDLVWSLSANLMTIPIIIFFYQ